MYSSSGFFVGSGIGSPHYSGRSTPANQTPTTPPLRLMAHLKGIKFMVAVPSDSTIRNCKREIARVYRAITSSSCTERITELYDSNQCILYDEYKIGVLLRDMNELFAIAKTESYVIELDAMNVVNEVELSKASERVKTRLMYDTIGGDSFDSGGSVSGNANNQNDRVIIISGTSDSIIGSASNHIGRNDRVTNIRDTNDSISSVGSASNHIGRNDQVTNSRGTNDSIAICGSSISGNASNHISKNDKITNIRSPNDCVAGNTINQTGRNDQVTNIRDSSDCVVGNTNNQTGRNDRVTSVRDSSDGDGRDDGVINIKGTSDCDGSVAGRDDQIASYSTDCSSNDHHIGRNDRVTNTEDECITNFTTKDNSYSDNDSDFSDQSKRRRKLTKGSGGVTMQASSIMTPTKPSNKNGDSKEAVYNKYSDNSGDSSDQSMVTIRERKQNSGGTTIQASPSIIKSSSKKGDSAVMHLPDPTIVPNPKRRKHNPKGSVELLERGSQAGNLGKNHSEKESNSGVESCAVSFSKKVSLHPCKLKGGANKQKPPSISLQEKINSQPLFSDTSSSGPDIEDDESIFSDSSDSYMSPKQPTPPADEVLSDSSCSLNGSVISTKAMSPVYDLKSQSANGVQRAIEQLSSDSSDSDDSSSDDRDSNDAENGKKFPSLNSLVDSAKGQTSKLMKRLPKPQCQRPFSFNNGLKKEFALTPSVKTLSSNQESKFVKKKSRLTKK